MANEYRKSLEAARKRQLKLILDEEKRFLSILKDARNNLTQLLADLADNNGNTSIRAWRAKRVKAELDRIISQMSGKISGRITRSVGVMTADVVEAVEDATRKVITDAGIDITPSFTHVPLDAAQAVMSRIGLDNLKLSDRVWQLDKTARNAIDRIVVSGIARGESAVKLSRNVQQYLLEPKLTPNMAWTTGVTKSVTGRGTVHYQALRLARTEINNAYHEARVQSAITSPVVGSARWILSTSHKIPDVCDVLAKANYYNMGQGVYPVDKVPLKPHPQCLCDTLDLIRPPSEWGKKKEKGNYRENATQRLRVQGLAGNEFERAERMAQNAMSIE